MGMYSIQNRSFPEKGMDETKKTVIREGSFIAVVVAFLSAIMELIFLLIGEWDYTVLLGNLVGAAVAITNFFLMEITICKSVGMDPAYVKKKFTRSYMLRLILMAACAILVVVLPCFNSIAGLIPLLFPSIGAVIRPFLRRIMGDETQMEPKRKQSDAEE